MFPSNREVNESIKKEFEEVGCKLLSDYVNRRTKVKYRCDCGNIAEIRIDSFRIGTRCRKCLPDRIRNAMKESLYVEKQKAVNLEKYGVENYFQTDEFKEKSKKTNIEKYGVENVGQSSIIKAKIKKTIDIRNGKVLESEEETIKPKIKMSLKKPIIIEKLTAEQRQIAGLMKYVADKKYTIEEIREIIENEGCILLSSEYKDNKAKLEIIFECGCYGEITFNKFNSHGHRCSNNECMNKKKEETNMKKFGANYYNQTIECKEKIKETNIKKYGCEHHLQNPEILENSIKNTFTKKIYTFPSGRTEYFQGYENIALDKLMEFFHEDEIIKKASQMPEIWYCKDDGKYHRYIPDIYVPSKKIIYEIKSTYILKFHLKETDYKRKAVEYLGYTYNLMLYNDNKCLLTTLKY